MSKQCLLSFDIFGTSCVVSFTHLLCLLVLFLPSIVLSPSPPAPTGFTGSQAPTGAVGAPEKDGTAAS